MFDLIVDTDQIVSKALHNRCCFGGLYRSDVFSNQNCLLSLDNDYAIGLLVRVQVEYVYRSKTAWHVPVFFHRCCAGPPAM